MNCQENQIDHEHESRVAEPPIANWMFKTTNDAWLQSNYALWLRLV